MANERTEGQLSGIRDYLASASYFLKVKLGIRDETLAAKLTNTEKMGEVMEGLEKINIFSEKRVVYGFWKGKSHGSDHDAIVIDLTIIKNFGQGMLNIRYLIATEVGFGHIRYLFDKSSEGTQSSHNISLHPPIDDMFLNTELNASDEAKINKVINIQTLNAYFEEYSNQQTWSSKFKTDLFLSPNDSDALSGQLSIAAEQRSHV